MPNVSVVLPAYNSELFIREAIDSILAQTYQDFELLLIDDGSTDKTSEIVREYEASDHRIRVHRLEQNRGLISALNWGCRNARGQYIAIMNSDDISLPERFAKQVEFLDQHPEIGILGTASQTIDESGQSGLPITVPALPGLIHWMLYFGNCIVHPTVMMRRDVVEAAGYYSPNAFLVDDYDLWMRISRSSDIANLPIILLSYRFWPSNTTALYHSQMETRVAMLVQQGISELLGRSISLETASYLRRIHDPEAGSDPTSLAKVEELRALIIEMYQTYTEGRSSLLVRERRLIANDAALKLMVLSKFAARYSIRESIRLAGYASQLSPWILVRVIQTLLRKHKLGVASMTRVED